MPKAVSKKPSSTISQEKKLNHLGREIIYPKVSVTLRAGDKAMTMEDAKKILGWTEVEKDHLFTDLLGKKVACLNNQNNRPFSRANADTIQQQILRRRWKLNGESMIIGESGCCLSVQHRLIGLILAVQEWQLHPDKWPLWESEPTIDCILVMGISEDDETVNTLDTGKTRSLADAIYRSEYFKGMSSKDRKLAARMTDYAVRMLWYRTGASDAFAPRRTHAESLDFINRHSTLLACVKHILEENEDNKLGKWLSPGYAAAIMYLMAVCKSDPKTYYNSDQRSESLLTIDLDSAEDFWSTLAGDGTETKAIQTAINNLTKQGLGSLNERLAILCHAWESMLTHGAVRLKDLELKYEVSDDIKTLAEAPTIGGIDKGDPKEEIEPDANKGEINKRVEDIKKEKEPKKDTTNPSLVWCKGTDGKMFSGELLKKYKGIRGENCSIKVSQGFPGAGTQVEISAARVSFDAPV